MAPLYAHVGDVLSRREQQKTEESNATLAVSGLVIALAVVSVGLRFYTRIFTKSGLKADDWSILSAVLFTLATAAVTLVGTYHYDLRSLCLDES
jgi:heme/copper-type cytochrome/quinol oxidase subunit 4